MTVYEKTRYKACPPEATVARIRAILGEMDIETDEAWTRSGVGELCSVRITLRGTRAGQNGKGATSAYALASGYAELMERMQTGFLFQHGFDPLTEASGGFQSAPDEETATPAELARMGGALLDGTLRRIRRTDGGMAFLPIDAGEFLEKWLFAGKDGRMAALPFQRLSDGLVEYLPEPLYRAYYFTNGSCAGNTREEALTQGLSEIMERWAASRILTEALTPPLIPDEAVKAVPSLWRVVCDMRARPGCAVRLMDASCGLGLPVAAAALIDRRRGTYVLRFGAHPRFEVALERALTEILQGRHIERLENAPRHDARLDSAVGSWVNRFNFAKAAVGVYPSALFGDEPSWAYAPFAEAPEEAEGQLERLMGLCERLGWTPYARDCSFLGFPTYHIVVPGESMVFDFGAERLVEKRRARLCRDTLRNPRGASREELAEALAYARMKRGWLLEDGFGFLAALPCAPKALGLPLDATLLAAHYALALGEYDEAAALLRALAFDASGAPTRAAVLAQLIEARGRSDLPAARAALREIYPEGWLEEARAVFDDPLVDLPRLECPRCEACQCAKDCYMPAAAAIMRRLREAMGARYREARADSSASTRPSGTDVSPTSISGSTHSRQAGN